MSDDLTVNGRNGISVSEDTEAKKFYVEANYDSNKLKIADSKLTVKENSLTDGDVAAANKDGVAGTPSMRTLGTGAQQAAAGNHTHSAYDAAGAASAAQTAAATDATTKANAAQAAAIAASCQRASNLSDVANVATARTNLGLGSAATKNVGTASNTVAAGDDSRLSNNAKTNTDNTMTGVQTFQGDAPVQFKQPGGTVVGSISTSVGFVLESAYGVFCQAAFKVGNFATTILTGLLILGNEYDAGFGRFAAGFIEVISGGAGTAAGLRFNGYTNSQRDAITSPVVGMLIFNTDNNRFEWYDGTQWTYFDAHALQSSNNLGDLSSVSTAKTNLVMASGSGTIDGTGQASIIGAPTGAIVVACWTSGAAGKIYVQDAGGGNWNVFSDGGGADSGSTFNWVAL